MYAPVIPEDLLAAIHQLLAVCSRTPERDIPALHLLLRNLGDGGQVSARGTRP